MNNNKSAKFSKDTRENITNSGLLLLWLSKQIEDYLNALERDKDIVHMMNMFTEVNKILDKNNITGIKNYFQSCINVINYRRSIALINIKDFFTSESYTNYMDGLNMIQRYIIFVEINLIGEKEVQDQINGGE